MRAQVDLFPLDFTGRLMPRAASPRQMAGPGRCVVDARTFREPTVAKLRPCRAVSLQESAAGNHFVFNANAMWRFLLRIRHICRNEGTTIGTTLFFIENDVDFTHCGRLFRPNGPSQQSPGQSDDGGHAGIAPPRVSVTISPQPQPGRYKTRRVPIAFS